MIIIDTSFLVALLHEDDAFHQQAISEMKKIEMETQLISDYVVNETATVLNNKAGLQKAISFIEAIKSTENVEIYHLDYYDFESTIKIFEKQRHKLSFIDASIVHLALTTQSKIATYDKNIIKEFEASKERL